MAGTKDFDNSMAEVAGRLSDVPSRDEYEFWEGPNILEEIRTGELRLGDILSSPERREMQGLISGVIGLLIRRHFGDEGAHLQLNILHTFTFPKQYEVPEQVIRSLGKKYRSGHLTRAWALRRLMYKLADLVIPSRTDGKDPLTSPVKLSPQADPKHPLYEHVVKNLTRGTTLQMLAIRVYLATMTGEGETGVDERSLKRDIQRLRRWEESDPGHMQMKERFASAEAGASWKSQIPVHKYSESWVPLPPDASEVESESGDKAPAENEN